MLGIEVCQSFARIPQTDAVPGLRIGQAGQALADEVAHPLTVKERTGSGERPKR